MHRNRFGRRFSRCGLGVAAAALSIIGVAFSAEAQSHQMQKPPSAQTEVVPSVQVSLERDHLLQGEPLVLRYSISTESAPVDLPLIPFEQKNRGCTSNCKTPLAMSFFGQIYPACAGRRSSFCKRATINSSEKNTSALLKITLTAISYCWEVNAFPYQIAGHIRWYVLPPHYGQRCQIPLVAEDMDHAVRYTKKER